MATNILWLHDVRFVDIAVAGAKGASLGELTWKGFPIPPGFIVSTEVYKRFCQMAGLQREFSDLNVLSPENLEIRCSAIRNKIQKTKIPDDLADHILTAYSQLARDRDFPFMCAVRSSATVEDLERTSFAGQHNTYYYVDEEHLLSMIKHCWASLWNSRVVFYRSAKEIDHTQVFMAVVVQEMIPAETAGVTFTINPVTGSATEIIIEASWGMGAAIVDGRVTPDRYVVERKGLKLREQRIAEKRYMVPTYLGKAGKGRLKKVPHEMRQQRSLSSKLIKTVAEWALKSETYFGAPQDVEWAISDGRFYLLQSRPVTTMGHKVDWDIPGQYVLHKTFGNNFTEPLTPLTIDLLRRVIPPGLKFIRGWAYYDLKYIRPILPFNLSDQELIDVVYARPEAPLPMKKLSFFKLLFSFVLLLYSYLLVGVIFARTRRMPDDFMEGFRALCWKVEKDPSFGPIETLQRLWFVPKIFAPIGTMPRLVNLSTIRYFLAIKFLKKLVRRWVPDIRDDAETLLCSGVRGLLSIEIGHDIWTLAGEVKRYPRVRELFLKYKPEMILPELRAEPDAQEFLEQLFRFLAKNGHRALKEIELQSVRWEENPIQILGMIRNSLLVESEPVQHEKKMMQARVELEVRLRRALENYPLESLFRWRWFLLRVVADWTKYLTKLRENSQFYHVMALYIARKKILQIEAELLRQGKLTCEDDIFFLRWEEISRLQSEQFAWGDVEDRIHERRLEHVRLSNMVPPQTLGIDLPEQVLPNEVSSEETIILHGQPVSPGDYEGIARVILDPSIDTELQPGEILVAPSSDPAWTPLFLTAGAAVVEVGSYLAYAGTIAREYGMPCLVDVAECTKRIQTGDRLKVDGERGVVRILASEADSS